jgi:hypothetical protein
MKFVKNAPQPGAGTGTGDPEGKPIYPRDFTSDAWVCDTDPEHYDPVGPATPH